MAGEERAREQALAAQKTLRFIAKHPNGCTRADFIAADMTPVGIERLLTVGLISAHRVPETKRGNMAFRWRWKVQKGAT
jgi:hypothetical protein